MGRSLFGKLHRRFGRRVSGQERQRRAAEHYERLRQAILVLGEVERVASFDAEEIAVDPALIAVVTAHDFHAGIGAANP